MASDQITAYQHVSNPHKYWLQPTGKIFLECPVTGWFGSKTVAGSELPLVFLLLSGLRNTDVYISVTSDIDIGNVSRLGNIEFKVGKEMARHIGTTLRLPGKACGWNDSEGVSPKTMSSRRAH
jgi:hypothetical protein